MVLFAGVSLLTAYAVALLAYLSAGGCGFGGFCQLNACARVESHLRTHLVGQELALAQLTDAVCDHVNNPAPRKPLVVSLHGPPGVGKTYFHKLLAEALYNRTSPGRPMMCDPGGGECPGYRVVFGTDYLATEREQQARALHTSLLGHLQAHPESVLVIEEFDKVNCASRGMLRQLLDKGATANFSFARSVVVLEANVGTTHLYKMLSTGGSRDALSAESAQRVLKDILFSEWRREDCEQPVDTQKTLSLVDLYVPFLPLERRHVRAVLETQLRQRREQGVQSAEFQDLRWGADALDFLVTRVEFEALNGTEYAVEGAKEASTAVTRHVSRALREHARGRDAPAGVVMLRLVSGSALVAEDAAQLHTSCSA